MKSLYLIGMPIYTFRTDKNDASIVPPLYIFSMRHAQWALLHINIIATLQHYE
jgi:hypothetical protein